MGKKLTVLFKDCFHIRMHQRMALQLQAILLLPMSFYEIKDGANQLSLVLRAELMKVTFRCESE